MSHQTAFIITSVTTPFPAEPDHELVRLAVEEAGVTAVNAAIDALTSETDNSAAPETLAVGCRQHRFIQGNILTNSETFVDTPLGLRPEQTFEIWGQNRGQKASAEDAPNSVLQSCWNHADRLIELAIRHHQSGRPIYPELLITPDGRVQHQLTHPDMDVFDDPSPGGTIALFMPDQDPAMAWHRAKAPLRDLEQAQFRIDYLRTLAAHMGHIVIEFDWNL